MLLSPEDEKWLHELHPGLAVTDAGVTGTIEFAASYDEQRNLFWPHNKAADNGDHGAALTGKFNIRLEDRASTAFSTLPALFVEEIEPISDRHFGADKSACLCSPLEEDEFLVPSFQFRAFVEKLVIPFLYGQLFYSLHHRWPWPEYAHFATGLLESYGQHPDPTKIENLLQTLSKHYDTWPAIKAALGQRDYIKGHTACFCPKRDQMRRCHPNALRGIQQLQRDIRVRKVAIP